MVVERFTARIVLSRDFTGETWPVKSSDIRSAPLDFTLTPIDLFQDSLLFEVDRCLDVDGFNEEVIDVEEVDERKREKGNELMGEVGEDSGESF